MHMMIMMIIAVPNYGNSGRQRVKIKNMLRICNDIDISVAVNFAYRRGTWWGRRSTRVGGQDQRHGWSYRDRQPADLGLEDRSPVLFRCQTLEHQVQTDWRCGSRPGQSPSAARSEPIHLK